MSMIGEKVTGSSSKKFIHVALVLMIEEVTALQQTNTEKWAKKRGAAKFFLTHFEALTFFKVLDNKLFKLIIKCGDFKRTNKIAKFFAN